MANQFEKWLPDARKAQGTMFDEATKREAHNDQARIKSQKLDGLKDYEKAQKTQLAKTAKLRELRLAKEAQDRVEAAAVKASAKPRVRGEKKDHAKPEE